MNKNKKVAVLLAGVAIISAMPHSVFAASTLKDGTNTQQIVSKENNSSIEDDKGKENNIIKANKSVKNEESSKVNVGWVKNSDGTYTLLDGKGNMIKSDWCIVGGKWYYFNENGIMQKGWVHSDGSWFFLDSNGNFKTGWIGQGQNWYYLNSQGAMVTGWNLIDGSWYYFNNSGEMQVGWHKINSKWYYFDNGGKMLSNTVIDGCTLGPKGDWV